MLLGGCKSSGDIDLTSGVGITQERTACPAIGVPDYTGDITVFDPASSRDATAIDVTAVITNVRSQCNEQGEQVYAVATFDVRASRRDYSQAREVTLPYYSTVVQGGRNVVSKRLGSVTLRFAAGEYRASTQAQAAAYIDRAAASLPDDIQRQITRERKPGEADAAIDPLAIPEVKAAVQRATFELLIGFQLTQDQFKYNVTR
ncbi:hypothetical protein FSZ31_06950 [Sphingorhabdus soli]|uniref:Uncharacterized protein n=1 Tax=Flavisphingopyxis soli TaxID=2601267 RepID=A0A5C6UAJ7_9SPHN|nr:hypothetical protein [Sphingorhabdus soli]TXC69281.1 hypothetical protein FSZ31_06950 [Sphingorhabdus soli]